MRSSSVGEHAGDLRHAFQIGAEQFGAAALFGGAARFGFGAAVMDGHARAFGGQAQGDAAADALGRAGHQYDFGRKLDGGFAMHFDLLRLYALVRGFGQPPGPVRPAPEYRGRGAEHAGNRADQRAGPSIAMRRRQAASTPSSQTR